MLAEDLSNEDKLKLYRQAYVTAIRILPTSPEFEAQERNQVCNGGIGVEE